MAEYTFEHFTKVSWVPTIASIAAPTAAEVTAGTDISNLLTKDGLQTPSSQNMVDNGTLADRFDAQSVGTYGGNITLKARRETVTDAAWNLFSWGEEGYLVVRRGVDHSTAFTVADEVEVYPAQSHEPVMDNSAPNANQTFTVALAVTSEPELRAVVV